MKQGSYLKGLILCGGTGSRLRPFTHSLPKQLLPLANKPVLFYVIEAMVEAGISDIGIVVNAGSQHIREALGGGDRFGARLNYIEQDAPRGLAHAVEVARPFLAQDPFAAVLGDNFLAGGLKHHVADFAAADYDARILLKPVADPSRFGVAVMSEGGRLEKLVEKPAEPPSNLAILGIYLLRPGFFDAARRISPSARGELEITDALQAMIDGGLDVRGRIIEEEWVDAGNAEELLRANRAVLDMQTPCWDGGDQADSVIQGNVRVAADAVLRRSCVTGPAVIGSGSELLDARIGPGTSVGEACRIVKASLNNSIVMNGSVVEGAQIEDSVLGRDVRVTGGGATRLKRLMLGDHARIEVA
jgi:glucose-1-phosphate thymidylyltransferase